MFAYAFPPYKAIGAIRLHAIARCMEKKGFVVNVFSTTNSKMSTQEVLSLDKLNVYNILTLDYKTVQFLVRKFRKKKSGTKNQVLSRSNKFSLLPYLISFPFNIFIGMGGFVYIVLSFLISFFKIRTGDIIISSYSPYADHLICFFHKIFRPKLIWICDFRDLHITPGDEEQIKLLKLNRFINKIIIRKADIVTSVSIGLLQELDKYSESTLLLKNAIHPDIAAEYTSHHLKLKEQQPKFSISYTGGLYSGRRDPSILFKALRIMIEEGTIDKNYISIVYAGPDSSIWSRRLKEFNLSDISTTYDMLPMNKSIEIQCNSSLNLLLTWATEDQRGILTGKFYEYLLAKRPILNIINGVHDSEVETLFEDLDAGVVFYSDDTIENISLFLKSYYNEWFENRFIVSEVHEKNLHENTWDNRVFNLLSVINE